MLSINTETINNPWTLSDVQRYEEYGSQRDKVIYNSTYNMRFILTEENVFLCSMKSDSGVYLNFYLAAATRSLFYILAFIPQMGIVEYDDNIVQKFISQLPVLSKAKESLSAGQNINDDISINDGSIVAIKVNACIEDFIFPRYGEIKNKEIKNKFKLMNKFHKRVLQEYDALLTGLKKYDQKVKEKAQKRMIKICTKVGINVACLACGIPQFGILGDLDTLFDIADASDIVSTACDMNISDLMNLNDELMI